LSCTVQLQQGWQGDQQDMEKAADQLISKGGTNLSPTKHTKDATSSSTFRPTTSRDTAEKQIISDIDNTIESRAKLALRTLEAIVRVVYEAADASNLCKEEQATTSSMVAFAMRNLAELPAARLPLIKHGALTILSAWIQRRPCTELHRNAVGALAALCESEPTEYSLSGAMAALESVLDKPTVHDRAYMDDAIISSGALAALLPLVAAPIATVRVYAVNALTDLAHRVPNRIALVQNGAVHAFIDVLARCVHELRSEPRRANATSLAEKAVTALTDLGASTELIVFDGSCATSDTDPRRASSMSSSRLQRPFEAFLSATTTTRRGNGDQLPRTTSASSKDSISCNEDSPRTHGGFLEEATRRESITELRPQLEGKRIASLIIETGGLPILVALVTLAEPCSTLRAMAVHGMALLTDEEHGCGPEHWDIFFQSAELPMAHLLRGDHNLSDDDDDTKGDNSSIQNNKIDDHMQPTTSIGEPTVLTQRSRSVGSCSTSKPSRKQRLRAPAAVDILLRVGITLDCECSDNDLALLATLLGDEALGGLLYRDQQTNQKSPSAIEKNFICCRTNSVVPAQVLEARCIALVFANLATRRDLASELVWRRGAVPLLLRFASSSRILLRIFAMRALASLATPLLALPDNGLYFDTDDGPRLLNLQAAAHTASVLAHVALEALDVAMAATRDRLRDETRRSLSNSSQTDTSVLQSTLQSTTTRNVVGDDEARVEELTYESVRAVKVLASAPPLRSALVARSLRYLLCIAIDAHNPLPQLRALAEVALVTLGFEGGANDLEVCGNDAKLLEEWFAMRQALSRQQALENDYLSALAFAWPPPNARSFDTRDATIIRDSSAQLDGFDSSSFIQQGEQDEITERHNNDDLELAADQQSTPRVSDTSSPGGWRSNFRPTKILNRVFRRPANLLRCASVDTGDDWMPPTNDEGMASPNFHPAAVSFRTPLAPVSSIAANATTMSRTPTKLQTPTTTPSRVMAPSVSPLKSAESVLSPSTANLLVVIDPDVVAEKNVSRPRSDLGLTTPNSIQYTRTIRSASTGHRQEEDQQPLTMRPPPPPRPNRLASSRRGSSSENGGVETAYVPEFEYGEEFVTIVRAAHDLHHWWESRLNTAVIDNALSNSSEDDAISKKLAREGISNSSSAIAEGGKHEFNNDRSSVFPSVLSRLSVESLEQFRSAADDGELPLQLFEYYKNYFPSAIERRRVLPMYRVPGGSLRWSPRCTRVLKMPARQYFSFRREGRVVQRVIEACDESFLGRRWGLVFRDAAFDGEFRTSLHACLSKNPSIESLAFVWTKTPVAGGGASGSALRSGNSAAALSGGGGLFDASEDSASGFFGGGSAHTSAGLSTELTNLVGQLPRSVAAITFDRALGSEALTFLGNLLKMAEQSRVSQQVHAIHNQASKSSGAPISAGPLLSFLAIRNHVHLQLNDFYAIIQYLNTCTATPPLPPPVDASFSRNLRWLDLSGNRLGDKGVSLVLISLARPDSSVTSLDLSDNSTGSFANSTLTALCGEHTPELNPSGTQSNPLTHASAVTSSPPGEYRSDLGVGYPAGTGQATHRGALFCGSRLRWLSLAHNHVGPIFAARLLLSLVDVPSATEMRSSLRGLSLEGSALHPPCQIGALQYLGTALKQLARSPGRLEELDLNRCKLVQKCGKELLGGLIEGHANPSQPTCDPQDEFTGHESETDTENGQLFPPMPSLVVSTSTPRSDIYRASTTSSSSSLAVSASAVRRTISEPLGYLREEENDPHMTSFYRIDMNEIYGSLGGLDDDFDEHDDESVDSSIKSNNTNVNSSRKETKRHSNLCHSRLSFVRISEGNNLDSKLIRKIKIVLRHNRLHRIHRAAMHRQSLRETVANTPRNDSIVTAEAKPVEETLMAIATAVTEPIIARAVTEENESSRQDHSGNMSLQHHRRRTERGEIKIPEDENESWTSGSSHSDSEDEEEEDKGIAETKEPLKTKIDEDDNFGRRTQSWPAGGGAQNSTVRKRQRRRGRRAAKKAARVAAQCGKSVEKFSVCALFSAPLAYQVQQSGSVNGIDALDFDAERERIKQGFDAARFYRDGVRVRFDVATIERLRTYVIQAKCDILHIAGHGHPKYLTFEDGRGGLQLLTPQGISKLMAATKSADNARLPKLAFVCACHSRLAADAFVQAGVHHVVAVALDAPLLDAAALEFTQAFYLAIAAGNSVASAFEIGVQAVANSAQVEGSTNNTPSDIQQVNKINSATKPKPRDRSSSIHQDTTILSDSGAGSHSKRFELLPMDTPHDEILIPRSSETCFKPLPAAKWPPEYEENDGLARGAMSQFRKRFGVGLPRPPRPPEDFLGREVDMYRLVENLARKRRLISVVGQAGSGKSALVAAVAVYISERHIFTDGVLFLRLDDPLAFSYEQVERALRDALLIARQRSGGRRHRPLTGNSLIERTSTPPPPGIPGNTQVSLSPFDILNDAKLLLIIEGLEKVDPTAKHLFLKQIMDEADGVCILSSSREPLTRQPAAFTEFVVRIGPLSLPSAARLFARQCPQLHTATDRKNFIKSIADHPHDKRFRTTLQSLSQKSTHGGPIAIVNNLELSARERRIIQELGNGYPGDIVARAFDTTKQSLRTLIEIAKPTPEDEATDNSTIRLAQLTAAGAAATVASASFRDDTQVHHSAAPVSNDSVFSS